MLPKDITKIKEWKENMSNKLKEVWKNKEYKNKQSESHKGYIKSKESIEKQREKTIGKKRNNYKKGYKQTSEHIEKAKMWRLDENKVKEWNRKREETNLKKYGSKVKPHSQEVKDKISKTLKEGQISGRIIISENFKREDVVEKRNKSRAEGFKNGKYIKFTNTKPELKCKSILEKYKINYEHQFEINYKLFDFYLPDYNLIIEIDGFYWHSRGRKDDEIINTDLLNRRKGDRLKNNLALNCGFRIIRFWEDELYKLEDLIKNDFIGLQNLEITENNFNHYLKVS